MRLNLDLVMVYRVSMGLLAAVFVFTSGCKKKEASVPKPETWLKLSFLGMKEIGANTNFAFLNEVAAKPSSMALAGHARTRLAVAAAAGLGLSPEAAGPLAGVLQDLTDYRAFVEVTAVEGATPEWVLAAAIPDDRSARWRQTLASVMAKGTNAPSLKSGTNAIVSEVYQSPDGSSITFLRVGHWSVLASRPTAGGPWTRAMDTLASTGRLGHLPDGALLKAESRLGAANRKLRWIPVENLPTVEVVVTERRQRLRSEERWIFDSPVVGKLAPWNVPKQTIHDDPLIAFTAGRGLGSLLKELPLLKTLQIEDALNEFYFWCQASTPPIMEYAAFRTADASNSVEKIAANVPEMMGRYFAHRASGEIRWATNRSGLVWEGAPVALPFVRALAEPAGQFVVAGLWPIMMSKTSIPEELVSQFVTKTNGVYYHWESTPERILHARPVGQLLGYLLTPYVTTSTHSPADKWLDDIGPGLGKTVVEAVAVSDRDLLVVRNAKLGVGAEGLVRLAQWIDHRDFPRSAPRFIFDPAPGQHRKSAPSSGVPTPPPSSSATPSGQAAGPAR